MKRALFFVAAPLFALLLLGQAPSEATPPEAAAAENDRPWFARYERYAVAADQQVASEVGAQILEEGGNAADAAAATMLALGVANPASSGMGGGGFALYYDASDGSLTFLDFRERAPAAATADMYVDAESPAEGPANRASQLGGLASGVPGEPAGVEALVTRFGSLPLSRIAAPAIALAEDGVPVSAPVARMSRAFGVHMKTDPVMRTWFEDGAEGLAEGQILRQPQLARTLRAFGRSGARAIYRGPIARQIVRANNRAGGIMTLADLADYEVVEREPLSATHFGLRWVTAPPPSAGGYTMLQSLAILERIPAPWRRPGSAWLHALAESWKGPFVDRERYFGDPDHVELPIERMMADARLDARAARFHPALAMSADDYDMPLEGTPSDVEQPDNAGTSHLCVVDAEGNVAAVTTTVNLPFGARYTAAGIVMNDEMDDFAREVGVQNAFGLVGGAPNLPGPGRRPVSTMSPTIVFRGDQPALCIGAAGGSRIVTATQQVALATLVLGLDPADALAAPRVHHQGRPGTLRTEEFAPLSETLLAELRARGHAHETIRNVATVQLIHIGGGEDGVVLGAGSDPRKGGRPAGR